MTRERSIRRVQKMAHERIMDLLTETKELLAPSLTLEGPFVEDEGGDCGPRWALIFRQHDDRVLDIYIELHLSEDYGDRPGGANFGLHLIQDDGLIVGECCPHNYTPEVWFRRRDLDAARERLGELLEAVGPGELAEGITNAVPLKD